jgi:hypothetical protein
MSPLPSSIPEICPECGGKVDPATWLCKWCGLNVVSGKHRKKGRWMWFVAAFIMFLCLLVGTGYWYWKRTTLPEKIRTAPQSPQEQQNIVDAALAIQKMRDAPSNPDAPVTISLLQALEKKLIELKCSDIPFQSSRIRFQILSLRNNPLQINIEPGLRLFNSQNGSDLITFSREVVKLSPKSAESREVLAGRLKTMAMSGDYRIEKLNSENPAANFVSTVAKDSKAPSWNVLQIAIWILNQNVDLETLRRERYNSPQSQEDGMLGATYPVAESIDSIDRAFKLLEKNGMDITKTQLYKDVEKTLALATEDYRNSQSDNQNLETIGFFRTRSEAKNILCEVFSRNPNAEGLQLRKTAFRCLSNIIVQNQSSDVAESQRIFEVLAGAVQKEKDEWLKQDMNHEMEKAKKALAQALVTKDNS